jgi:hypothetical protein
MANGPFKLKGWSPFTKTSPAKTEGHGGAEDHTHPKTEVHEMTGQLNEDKTRVVDEEGNWVGVGDRPDLVKKSRTLTSYIRTKPE